MHGPKDECEARMLRLRDGLLALALHRRLPKRVAETRTGTPGCALAISRSGALWASRNRQYAYADASAALRPPSSVRVGGIPHAIAITGAAVIDGLGHGVFDAG